MHFIANTVHYSVHNSPSSLVSIPIQLNRIHTPPSSSTGLGFPGVLFLLRFSCKIFEKIYIFCYVRATDLAHAIHSDTNGHANINIEFLCLYRAFLIIKFLY
jgi:hypothetical protein